MRIKPRWTFEDTMKVKLKKLIVQYLITGLPWRMVKALMIEMLNRLPPIRRELVIREIVARNGLGHAQGNPRRG